MIRALTRPRPLFALAIGLTVGMVVPSVAIDAGDMDPHLPDEVVLATMRFHAFTRKAKDKKEWEKKHAELLKLLDAQLEAAALNDNRAAIALRTLRKDLTDARYVVRKAPAKKLETEYPVLPNGYRVMVKEQFHIAKAEKRVLTFPFEVKQVPAMLHVGIGGGSDDSGDRGLHYLLIDPIGRVIKRGFADEDDYVWEQHLGTRRGTWKLIIQDLDTRLTDKKRPGNRGAVEVLVKAE